MRRFRMSTRPAWHWGAWHWVAFCLAAMVAAAAPLRAADPQPYTVTLKPTGDGALDSALNASSTLISLRTSTPVGGFALTGRARDDRVRFETALHSFGYYKASIDLTIDGRALDDPALPDLIDALPATSPVAVVVSFDLGPSFTLGAVTITGQVPADVPGHLNLHSGDPAVAESVLAAQGRLLAALKADGYPLAKVPVPVAILHPDQNTLDVAFQPDTGPHADIGPVTISGLTHLNQSFVQKRLLLHQNEAYSPDAIEKARADLNSLGVFSVVRAEPAGALDANGQLPVNFDLTERPLHAVDFGVAYATDLGLNFTTAWHDRDLFGNAEQLNLTATALAGGNAVTKPGYQVGAQFLKPDYLARDQTLEIDLNAIDQSLPAYDQKAVLEKIALNRKLSPHWTASLGLSGEQETILQESITRQYNLAGIPATLKYDDTNNLLDPTRGVRATLSVTPTYSLGALGSTFFISQLAGSTYLDLSGGGRSVLALRGLVGEDFGTDTFGLPPDQRFYAGGSATVRGYRYQTLGPQFADRTPTGGTSVAAATVEFRQRILSSYGIVGFIDMGQVNATGAPFSGNWHEGAGIGARYYTSIGPIRLDVAVPLDKLPGGDSFEVYIGIGQAF